MNNVCEKYFTLFEITYKTKHSWQNNRFNVYHILKLNLTSAGQKNTKNPVCSFQTSDFTYDFRFL